MRGVDAEHVEIGMSEDASGRMPLAIPGVKAMRRIKVEEMLVAELVDRFAQVCLEQDHALLYSDISKFNRIYQEMLAVR